MGFFTRKLSDKEFSSLHIANIEPAFSQLKPLLKINM